MGRVRVGVECAHGLTKAAAQGSFGSKLCGENGVSINVSTMVSTGNVMTLHFISDGTTSLKGFKIRASATRGK